MPVFGNIDGTYAKEFYIGKGDMNTLGEYIIGVRATSDGYFEYKHPGGEWRRIGAQNDGAKDPTGFVEDERESDSTLSVVDGTRTFSIDPTGASFRYFYRGAERVISSQQSVVFSDTDGIHYMYFNASGTLVTSMLASDWIGALLGGGVLVAFVQWDATNGETIFLADERHGLMPGLTHYHLHRALGMQWYSGGQLTDIDSDGTGDDASNAQLGVASIEVGDEDIRFSYSSGSPQTLAVPAQIPIYFREGASGYWRKKTADSYPLIYSGTAGYTGASGRAAWNEWTGSTWQLSEVGNLDFFLVHYYATNEMSEPIIGIQGQVEYSNIVQAREGARSEISSLATSGLEIVEFTALGTVIFQTGVGYSNTPASRIRQIESGVDYIDWRTNEREGSGGGVTIHGQLDGLLEDDHTQYLLVDGTRAMSGALDMGTGAITNVGNVDGRDISVDGAAQDSHIADTANPHATDLGNIGSGTLSELNGKVTDATLDDSSDTRTPSLHSSSHENGGGDEIDVGGLSGELADAQPVTVRKNEGSNIGTRSRLNFEEGDGISIGVTDDGTNDEVDVEVSIGEVDPSLLSSGEYIATMPVVLSDVDDASTVSGSPLFLASDGNMDRCDASAISTMPCRAIALESGAGSGKKTIIDGFLGTTQTWSTIGGEIYVSETTGELTQTPFTTANSVVQSVGYAFASNVMRVKIGAFTEN